MKKLLIAVALISSSGAHVKAVDFYNSNPPARSRVIITLKNQDGTEFKDPNTANLFHDRPVVTRDLSTLLQHRDPHGAELEFLALTSAGGQAIRTTCTYNLGTKTNAEINTMVFKLRTNKDEKGNRLPGYICNLE